MLHLLVPQPLLLLLSLDAHLRHRILHPFLRPGLPLFFLLLIHQSLHLPDEPELKEKRPERLLLSRLGGLRLCKLGLCELVEFFGRWGFRKVAGEGWGRFVSHFVETTNERGLCVGVMNKNGQGGDATQGFREGARTRTKNKWVLSRKRFIAK